MMKLLPFSLARAISPSLSLSRSLALSESDSESERERERARDRDKESHTTQILAGLGPVPLCKASCVVASFKVPGTLTYTSPVPISFSGRMFRITHSGSSHATACTFESLFISSLGTGVFFIFMKSEMRLRSKRGTHRLIIPPLGGGEFGAAVTHFPAFHGLLSALYGCWHVNRRHFYSANGHN